MTLLKKLFLVTVLHYTSVYDKYVAGELEQLASKECTGGQDLAQGIREICFLQEQHPAQCLAALFLKNDMPRVVGH